MDPVSSNRKEIYRDIANPIKALYHVGTPSQHPQHPPDPRSLRGVFQISHIYAILIQVFFGCEELVMIAVEIVKLGRWLKGERGK